MKTLLNREDSLFNPPHPSCVLSLTGLPGGDGKIYDRSPYGNHGTIIGATWVRLPSGLWCLDFDGVDDRVAHTASVRPTNVTLSAWINSEDVTNARAIGGWFDVDGQIGTYFAIKDNKIRFVWSSSSGDYRIYDTDVISTLTISAWLKITVTQESSNVPVAYLNGTSYSMSLTASGGNATLPTGSLPLSHGRAGVYDGIYHKGSIALFTIHNRVLSALEIQGGVNREKNLFGVW